jgi:uncharacterized protein YecA (UPF0149 family)
MDVQTGKIYDNSVIQQLIKDKAILDGSRFRRMELPPTPTQMTRKPPRIGRNDPCPCGSGAKFKKCCLRDPADNRFK